jgi:hypothetical protein
MESPTEEFASNSVAATSENEILETNKRIIEFVHDLKNAIENGHLKNDEPPPPPPQQHVDLKSSVEACDPESSQNNPTLITSQISNLMNVNNLSNHTFSYIINWLKTHQQQKQQQDQQNNSSADEVNKVLDF